MSERSGGEVARSPGRSAARCAAVFGAVVPLLLLIAWWWPLPGPSGSYALLGRLPWSDGFDYWSAAQHLLQQGRLDEWGSRRPINGAFLAARLAMTGDHLLGALMVQSLLLGAALASLVWIAWRRFGAITALPLGAMLLVPIASVQSTTQSEGLGLLLALAAMSALLRACDRFGPRTISFALGLALLMLAMLVRPGALLMVPALAVGAVFSAWRRGGRGAAITITAGAVASISIGVSVNGAARLLFADPSALSNANFSGTVLGIARGSDYYEADAWLRSQLSPYADERERSELAYSEAWRLVREQPGVVATSLVRNAGRFGERGWPLFILAAVGVLRARSEERWLWISGWCGIVLSVPIIYGDGGIRCLAASWPFMLASAASALRRRAAPSPQAALQAPHETRWCALGVGAAMLAVAGAIVVPRMARTLGWLRSLPPHGSFETDQYPAPGTEWVDWVRSPPAFHAIVVARDSDRAALPESLRALRTLDPDSLSVLAAFRELGEPIERVPTPHLFVVAYDLGQRRARFYLLPATAEVANAIESATWAIRIDTVPLAPGSRVSVGKRVAPVTTPPPLKRT